MENQIPDSQVVGIDLGTTYSCVSVFRNSSAEIIPNSRGNWTTPSYVAFTENETLVGDAAKDQSILNYKNTIFDSKRLMGCSISDSVVKKDIPYWPFEIIEKNGEVVYRVKSRGEIINPTPQKIASEILSHLKESTENSLGNPVRDAVVTVPAYFNNAQRQSTIDAGIKAGLNILSILNEPTAAAIAYGFDNQNDNSRNVIVFDLGGGTFDVSLLNITRRNFRVLATHGNTHLGGNDFDLRLVEYLQQEFENNSGYNIENDRYATSRLRIQSERVKCELSSNETALINIDSLHDEVDFHLCISRDKFNNLCDDLFTSTLSYLDAVLGDAKLNISDIDDIIMIGGSTRICRVQELVSNYFDDKDINLSINPEEAVARGAAIHASKLTDNLENAFKDLSLVDVTPISLGIEIVGDILSTVVPRNTELPFSKTGVFSTEKDYQTSAEILVYEGEKKFSKANHFLGEFLLTGIPPALRCVPEIDVTFAVDTNGVLKVRAYDRKSHNSEEIKIIYNVNHCTENKITKDKSRRKVGDIVLA